MPPPDDNVRDINTRLAEASARGESLEVILVLRGKVRPVAGTDRWCIRERGGRVVTFRAGCVVAATTVPRGNDPTRR